MDKGKSKTAMQNGENLYTFVLTFIPKIPDAFNVIMSTAYIFHEHEWMKRILVNNVGLLS